MNFVFDANYPHTTRGTVSQHIINPGTYARSQQSAPSDILSGHWPLQDINFHVQLDHAISEWKSSFYQEIDIVEQKGVDNFSASSFNAVNELMNVWLKVAKKMEFYRLDADFKKLVFNKNGLYRLYDFGNLKSIYLLSEIEKYRALEEGTTLSDLHMEEHASIFRDVSLKIGRHVLTELKR